MGGDIDRNQVFTAFLCQHGCIVLWVFTSKSLLPFCVSMDVLCSGCLHPSHYCLSVSAWMYRALSSQQSHYCLSVSAWMYCALCSLPSLYCLSVSALMYCAPGVHNQVITVFLCQHGCIVLCVHSQVITAFLCQHGCIVFCVHNQVITAFMCQHGCIVLWVFTAKSLLPFCVSMGVSCSGCSQPSHYCLYVSAWMYRA
ncbi:hypothetical protein DPMN_190612 [Dreissena polymorpha]|uniref:Uncharacterized protein n=1 Tax=Dreissena polymorpha TaxID=45954 RepID=A0A9D4BEH6_DREPO|nr:hypothetical protein DPMN_190612 [Dreissena polymorpha]